MRQKRTSVISQKGNYPMLPKQEVKDSIYPLRAAVGDLPAWSPTALLAWRSEALIWQSGRDASFSSVYGRRCPYSHRAWLYARLQPGYLASAVTAANTKCYSGITGEAAPHNPQ